MRNVLLVPLAAFALLCATGFGRAETETTGSLPSAENPAPDAAMHERKSDLIYLSDDEKSKIRAAVLTSRAPRVSNARFSLDVGTVVPPGVRTRTVPPVLVDVHPALRGYAYFVVGDDIVIIEPGTSRIVAIIAV